MMLRAYCIFDSKALVYHQPFFAPTNGAAIRMLADIANDVNTSIGRHPADYVLYCVGHYNDQDGGMSPYSPREHVVDAVALLRINNQLPLLQDSVAIGSLKGDILRELERQAKEV